MKYTQNLLDSMIQEGFETNHVDFKEGFNWKTFDDDMKAKIAKHLAALSNIEGGGVLIFGITDKRQVKGLKSSDIDTFDRTWMDQMLEKYLNPLPRYSVQQVMYERKRLLIIEVEEFQDIPIICKTGYPKILRTGGVYIRQNAGSTVIHDSHSMRNLIELATKKKKQEILASIEHILDDRHSDEWKL